MSLDSIVIIIIFIVGWCLGYTYGFKKGGHSFNNNNCWSVLFRDLKLKWPRLKK